MRRAPWGALALALATMPTARVAAQETAGPRSGWMAGVVGFTGGTWDPTAFEAAWVGAAGSGRASSFYLGGRVGSWTSQASSIGGGTRGWMIGAVIGLRRGLVSLIEVGDERRPNYGLLTGGLEVTGNFDIDAPTGGNGHATVAALLGFAYSDGATVDEGFSVVFGPAWYLGLESDVRAQVALRFQSPFGRRRR